MSSAGIQVGDFYLLPGVLEGFERGIQSNLVSELEAITISDGLGNRRHRTRYLQVCGVHKLILRASGCLSYLLVACPHGLQEHVSSEARWGQPLNGR